MEHFADKKQHVQGTLC